jgi:hypothetical protein
MDRLLKRDHLDAEGTASPPNHGPGGANLDGICGFPSGEKRYPQVDIPGLIWYIRAFDKKGMAFLPALYRLPNFR